MKNQCHCEEARQSQQKRRHCEETEGRRGNLLEIVATSRGWLTGDVVSPALRAHFVRPKSFPTILSLRSQ